MNHYYIPLTDQPDENTFLCGYNRVRKYGTTVSLAESKPQYYIYYHVLPTDTMQGIALKHNCSVSEIVRVNRLWSVEALHLKDVIKIPVPNTPDSPSTSSASFSVHRSRPSSPKRSPTNIAPKESPQESMKDILSRIDKTIKTTSSSVKKLEKSSTISSVDYESRPEHNSLQNLCSDYYQQI